jgi:hypothetical protein
MHGWDSGDAPGRRGRQHFVDPESFPSALADLSADSRVRALSDSEHHLIEMIGAECGSEHDWRCAHEAEGPLSGLACAR